MLLLSAPASPFGRKVKITAQIKGLMDRISVEAVDTSRTDNHDLKARNPLQKIPVLVLDDGTELYDSRVICEYLDSLVSAPSLFPQHGRERFDVLKRGAMADGVMEAALLLVYERRFRSEDQRSPLWVERQQSKIDAVLDLLWECFAGPLFQVSLELRAGRARADALKNMAKRSGVPERVIEAQWARGGGPPTGVYACDLHVEANDRQGLLRDISDVLSREKVNVTAVKTQSRAGMARMAFTVELASAAQLQKMLAVLGEVMDHAQIPDGGSLAGPHRHPLRA